MFYGRQKEMPIEIGNRKFFTMKEFSEEVGRAYSYIRKCVHGLERAKDISEYVKKIENKPMIQEDAKSEFEDS